MKSIFWILKIEFFQNKFHFYLIFLIAFLLGVSGILSLQAERKISELAIHDQWDADMVVLPKGVTLNDFRSEILSAKTTEFLPEAMFDTTVSMANKAFKLTAVLALTDEKSSRILVKGNSDIIGLSWLGNRQNIVPWEEQHQYKTPEWENKVLTGFFAAGPKIMMKNFKELIDKRTVGQAIDIKLQKEHDEKVQSQLEQALVVYSGTLILLIFLSFISLLLLLKIRISNSLNILEELGFSQFQISQLLLSLFIFSVISPLVLGVLTTSLFSIF